MLTTSSIPASATPHGFTDALCDQLPGMYYRIKASSLSIIRCSKGCLDLLGYTEEELVAQPDLLLRLIHPDDNAVFINTHSQPENGLLTVKYRIAAKNGQYKWIKDEFITIFTDEGEAQQEGHLTLAEDISMKQQLLSQLKAYRDAIDVNIISSITDIKGNILYANKNFCEISKYEEHELIGKNHRIVCSGHHPKEFFSAMWKTISSGKAWHGEILNKSKTGDLYWVDTVIIPVSDDLGKISHYLSLRTLINGRKEAEKQKDEYIGILEDIAFIVAHRIRGPICSIEGLVNLLGHNEDQKIDPVALEHLRTSVDGLDLITHQLSNLLYTKEIDLKRKNYQDRIRNSKESSDQ